MDDGAVPEALSGARARSASWWMLLAVALVLLKIALVLADPQLRLFLGDSASYLFAARKDDWNPPDRSFVYPFLIEWATGAHPRLSRLLGWQSLAGVATALLLAYVLRTRLALPRTLVFVAVCLFAIGPAQLFYERMVMAETFGLLAFAGFVAASSAYLARRHPIWLPVVAMTGLAAVSLRMNYLPVVLVISVVLPLLPAIEPDQRRWLRTGLHLAIALASVAYVHGLYKAHVGDTFGGHDAYLGHAGTMRMGLVAPLIKPKHFARVGLPSDFADRLAYDLADPDTRPQQLWSKGGLADEIGKTGLDVDRTCRKLAMYALRDDPLGLVTLGFHTLGGYFDADTRAYRLGKDLARDRPYPDDVLASVERYWHYDMTGVDERWTLVSRAFAADSYLLVAWLLLIVPMAVANVIVFRHDPRRVQIVLGALFGVGLFATEFLFSNIASYRYLHPLPLVAAINGLPLAGWLWAHRRRSGAIAAAQAAIAR